MGKSTASQIIDDIFETLGVYGKYQLIQVLVVCSLSWPATHQLFSFIYIGYQPPLRCHIPVNSSLYTNASAQRPYYPTCKDLEEKENVTSCPHGYDYDLPKDASFTSEWDLVCDRSYQAQLTQTILVLGQAIGATLFTIIADMYGRQKACILSQWFMLIISTGIIFSPSVVVYTVLRCFIGIAQQGNVMSFSVMPLETLPTNRRAVAYMFTGIIWAVFLTLHVGLAYIMRDLDWRYSQAIITGTTVLTLIINMAFLEESIRWLFANERVEQVKKILRKAAKLNKVDPDKIGAKAKACIEETAKELHGEQSKADVTSVNTVNGENSSKKDAEQGNKNVKHKGSIVDIMRDRRLRITTLIMFFAWVVDTLTSFGLALTSAKLSGNRFINYFLVAFTPLPATFASYFCITKLGRKKTAIIFHAVAGVSLITAVLLKTFVESVPDATTAFTMLGQFGIFGAWGTLFMYTPELYPTNLRSLGLGISSSASRIGGMLAPFSNLVIDYIPWLPGTVYGCSCLVVCLLVLYLPETLNRELPQTLDEIREWNNNDKTIKEINGGKGVEHVYSNNTEDFVTKF